jgi:hypothetical protein
MIRNILAAAALGVASLLTAAAPALASAHTPFMVTVNGGTDVTYQHLTAGQVVYKGGVAEHVVTVNGYAVRFSPAVAGPAGARYQFST